MNPTSRSMNPFVKSKENDLGTGRVEEMSNGEVVVSYFHSPADDDLHYERVASSSVRLAPLDSQTRVYFHDPETLVWMVGRVLDYQKNDAMYLVRFPNEETRLIPESLLHVRWNRPIDEPTDLLALRLTETPFWHAGRSDFIKCLYDQRNHCGGIPAALSSSIDLVKHQLAVVRRILHDPFQRYLLADEVGLGKTIEAAILIRQFSLDEPSAHSTLVIVPEALASQWRSELIERFHLGDLLDESIHVVTHNDHERIATLGATARMVVVDEAHHVAAGAWSAVPELRRTFAAVCGITNSIDRRVLLLSATPVLHNEAAFLAMLHLLDPPMYPLDDLDGLKTKIRHRQQVAEALLSLTEDEQNYFLEGTLQRLGNVFQSDIQFDAIRAELLKLIEADVAQDDPNRRRLIRQLRYHVSETWRLHRRLLRNRRTPETACYLPGRRGIERKYWHSDEASALEERLGEWRNLHSGRLYGVTDNNRLEPMRRLVREFEEAGACDPQVLAELITQRLDSTNSSAELSEASIPTIDEEERLILEVIRTLADATQHSRLTALFETVEQLRQDQSSVVVFTNHRSTADLVHTYLAGRIGNTLVIRHDPSSANWSRFRQTGAAVVLVCDHRAEEGLNLQCRRASAVHYDLPFSPNRIEQRMGRLDRFGSGRPVTSIALVLDRSRIQSGWLELMSETFGVFDRSIASLQYLIEDEIALVWSQFPDAGADAFVDAVERLGGSEGRIEEEFRRIRAQDELDSFEHDALTSELFESMERSDFRAAAAMRESLDQWLVSRLQFRGSGEHGSGDDVTRYQYCRLDDFGRLRGKNTLVPYRDFTSRFGQSIDDPEALPSDNRVLAQTVPLTFNRQVSQRRVVRLARIGDPLVDEIERQLRWDDRGICYAMWRYMPNYQSAVIADLYFRFDFVVEANKENFGSLRDEWPEVSIEALRRRADNAFPPLAETIWLDMDLKPVRDAEVLRILDLPYRNRIDPQHRRRGRDYNLNSKRWPKVEEVCDLAQWRGHCHSARDAAELILREHSKLPKVAAEHARRAAIASETYLIQFDCHLAKMSGLAAGRLNRERQFEVRFSEELQNAITTPSLRPDSVGAVFISSRVPFGNDESEDEL